MDTLDHLLANAVQHEARAVRQLIRSVRVPLLPADASMPIPL